MIVCPFSSSVVFATLAAFCNRGLLLSVLIQSTYICNFNFGLVGDYFYISALILYILYIPSRSLSG